MIQIRNAPDALHRRLKARAALEGKSLLRARLARRSRVTPSIEPALALRAERGQA
jgi:plasmid stability protein